MSVRYPADPVHSKIRLALFLTLCIGGLLGYFAIMPVIFLAVRGLEEWAFCLRFIGAVGIGLLASWVMERILVPIWPSGRFVEVDGEHVVLHGPKEEPVAIEWKEPVKVTTWHFKVQRGGAVVPRGWHCVAFLLVQEDRLIAAYSFAKPETLQALPGWDTFQEFPPQRRPSLFQRNQAQEMPSEELRLAERYRWNEGCELLPDDFNALMAAVAERVSDWP
jgi:hypothetical protein